MKRAKLREDGCSNRRSMFAYAYAKMCSYLWKSVANRIHYGVSSPQFKKSKARQIKWQRVAALLRVVVNKDEGEICI